MSDLFRNPSQVRAVLRRRTLRECYSAVVRLGAAARGIARFGNELDLRAAVALARLAPVLMRDDHQDDSLDDEYWTPERKAMLDEYIATELQTPEECAESWAKTFLRDGPDNKFSTIEEAREYGRRLFYWSEEVGRINAEALRRHRKHR